MSKNEDLNTWFSIKGDATLRLNYNLNDKSVVFDLGGYVGKWASDIYAKYECDIYVFEPVSSFYQFIINNVSNEKIKVYPFGLSNKNSKEIIYLSNDGSSIYQKSNQMASIELIDICDFIEKNNISKIDLMKINVEGEEFNILEHLISTGKISDINNIQVQFHDFIPNAIDRRNKIREELQKTHKETYCYEFIWENWEKKI